MQTQPATGAPISKIVSEARTTADDKRKTIIDVQKVFKDFVVGKQTVNILKNINVRIYEGEFIMLFGPSGSGKSTLLNAIVGLEIPTSGSVMVSGEDLAKMKPDKRSDFRMENIGVVHQRPEWIRSLSVIDNVCFPLAVNGVSRGERESRGVELLKQFGQEHHATNRPTDLSGGEQQRVTIARALINDPKIIIADEPTGNLDTKSTADVMAVFRILNEESGKTIIMVSHNMDLVKFATRAVYMRDGRIISGEDA